MNEQVDKLLKDTKIAMEKAVVFVETELTKIRAGKATPSMLDSVMVDYYGNPTPLSQVANVSTPDARTIQIQPWEKTMIEPIEKAIMEANLGLNPSNDGHLVRINIPTLTEERRKDLVKSVKAEGEHGKIAIRNIRKDTNDTLKRLKADGLSEDAQKEAEGEVQKLTDLYSSKVDNHIERKEVDIMKV